MSEITPEEARRQAGILWPIRLRHHSELGRLGIAQRVMDAPTRMNYLKSRPPIGETTLLWPFRAPLGGEIGNVLGSIERLIEKTEPKAASLINIYSAAYDVDEMFGHVLGVGRFDATPGKRKSFSRLMYFAGVQLLGKPTQASPQATEVACGFEGIPDEDANELARMLAEVSAAKAEYDLTCLNPSLINAVIEDTSRGLPLP